MVIGPFVPRWLTSSHYRRKRFFDFAHTPSRPCHDLLSRAFARIHARVPRIRKIKERSEEAWMRLKHLRAALRLSQRELAENSSRSHRGRSRNGRTATRRCPGRCSASSSSTKRNSVFVNRPRSKSIGRNAPCRPLSQARCGYLPIAFSAMASQMRCAITFARRRCGVTSKSSRRAGKA